MYGPPRSKYFEIFGPPLKYLDRVRSACCSRVVNCTKTRFVRSWDDTLLTRCHEPSLLPIRDEETSSQNVEGEETYNVSSVKKKKRSVRVTEGNPILVYCSCRMPEVGDMIECSNCEEWFHVPSCSSPTQAALNDTTSLWFCNKCNN